MLIIVFIAFLAGIIRYRFLAYWTWAVVLLIWMIVGPLLFAGGGTLIDPAGDGIITHQVRVASNDGPAVGLVAIAFLIVFWGGVIYITSRMFLAVKARKNAIVVADATPLARKAVEVIALLVVTSGWAYWQYSLLSAQRADSQIATPGPNIDPIAKQLELVAAQLAAEGPKQLDPITVLENVTAQGRTLIYKNRLTRRDASDEALLAFLKHTTLPNVCGNANMRKNMDDYGITYRYSYTFPNSKSPILFDVNTDSCRAAKL